MCYLAATLPFDFQQPAWLWLILLVPVFIFATLRSLAGLEPARRVFAVAVRSLLVVLVACCLAGIERVRRSDDLTVMFLMDRSHSVEVLEDEQTEFIRQAAKDIRPEDRVGLIDFAHHSYLQQLPMPGGFFLPPGRLPPVQSGDRTDIAAAIRLAMAMFPHDTAKRIVLMSDGNSNLGDVLAEARRAGADGIPIDIVPLRYERRNEVYFEKMLAPTYAEAGEQVPVRMVINSQLPATGSLAVYHNGQLVELPAEESRVTLQPGSNTFSLKLPVNTAGTQTYEAQVIVDDKSLDSVALNNTGRAFSFVAGASPVLILTRDPPAEAALLDALQSERVQAEIRNLDQMGEFGLLQMMNYSSVILANIPAAAFTDAQQQDLATYVKDMGSGLIMTGGPDSFGAGGWIGSPVEEVMPVSFEIKHKRVIPKGALVLIMHSCEIARGNYWGKEMAKKSVDTVSSRDLIGVLAYTFTPGGNNWEVPLQENTNKAAVKARIDRMQIGDMPDFHSTMQMAFDELNSGSGKTAAQKHVIILSDGDAQPPSQSLLDDFAKAKITVSTIGIGWGAHVMEATLSDIAKRTDGRYYPARSPRELPQIFSKESTVVRRPLIIDEPFSPQLVPGGMELLGGFRAGAEGLPALGGMVLTSPKDSPNAVNAIYRASEDGEDPVLAYWQYELGKSVAFTSGHWPAWGQSWTSWPRFAKFWAQLVRWTMRQESPANFDTYTKIEGGRARIVIDALDKDASYLNHLQLRANLVGPDQRALPILFTQTGPGHYEAEFDAEKAGQYLANVQVYDQGKHLGTVRTGLSVPFSPEYRDLSTNEAVLRQIAEVSGGRWLDLPPDKAGVFEHDLPPSIARRPAWDWTLAWLFLPAFLLDVAVRRLASWLLLSIAVELVILVVLLFGLEIRFGAWWSILGAILFAELVGWTIRFRYIGVIFRGLTHSVTVLEHAGERSTEALGKLKGTRERVRGGMRATGDTAGGESAEADGEGAGLTGSAAARARRAAAGRSATTEAVSRDVARRRYDVGESKSAAPAGDLHEALGGAKTAKPVAPKKRPAGGTGDAAEESTTSRLLKAKKRAQDGKEDP